MVLGLHVRASRILTVTLLVAFSQACVSPPHEESEPGSVDRDEPMDAHDDMERVVPDTSAPKPDVIIEEEPDAGPRSVHEDMRVFDQEDMAQDAQGDLVDPCTIDTDGDTLTDCEEEAIGSDPSRIDSDFEGIPDAEEITLGTSPVDEDSDDDWLTDFEEQQIGTDPLDPDTDGDGVRDGEEVQHRLDPFQESSLDNGVLDRDLFIHTGCAGALPSHAPAVRSVMSGDFLNDSWMVVLPQVFTHDQVVAYISPERYAGANTYDDASAGMIAGFTLSVPKPGFMPVGELIQPYQVQLAQMGTIVQYTTSPDYRSRHDFRTRTATFDVMLEAPSTLLAWRNQMVHAFGHTSPDDLEEPLSHTEGAESTTRFLVKLSVIERAELSLVMVSVMPRQAHSPHTALGRAFSQSADATNVSVNGADEEYQCTFAIRKKGKIIAPWRLPVSSTLVVYRSTPEGDGFEWVPQSREHGFDYDAVTNTIELFGDYDTPPASLNACTEDVECATHERCAHQRCVARQPQHYIIQSMDLWAAKWPRY